MPPLKATATAWSLPGLLAAALLLAPTGQALAKREGSPLPRRAERPVTVAVTVPAGLPCTSASRTEKRTSYLGCPSSPETLGGPAFLEHYAAELGLQTGLDNLRLSSEQPGLSGKTYRYIQTLAGIPVDGAWVTVVEGGDGHVRAVHSSYREVPGLVGRHAHPMVSAEDAELIAAATMGVNSLRLPTKAELVWYPTDRGSFAQSWRVLVYGADPLGDFHTIVDTTSGKVLEQRDIIVYLDTGSGYAYVPNPIQVLGDTSLEDNSDLTDGTLDAARSVVTLEGLNGSTGRLIGEYADVTLEGGLGAEVADETSRVYLYDRDDDRFEDVVTYHSIDSMQRRFHALGFDDHTGAANGIRDFPTKANTHWMEDDQAFYSTGDDALHFGDGGVDDGEDADVVAHEYGHAVQHYQNACWGGAEMGAMGEGFGDYLAGAFYSGSGDSTYQAAHAACIADWDASAYSFDDPPCLRRIDGNKTYPDDLTGLIHTDGEIWSAALWEMRATLGANTADTLVLEHHFSLTCSATMRDAALEIVAVDGELNGGANAAAITEVFCDRGIFDRDDCPTLDVEVTSSPSPASSGETVSFTLTVTNSTNQILTGITLTATVPEGSSYTTGSASDGGYLGGDTVQWTSFALSAGGSVTRSFSVTVGDLGSSSLSFYDDVESGADDWELSHGTGLSYHWTIEQGYGHAGTSAAASARAGSDGDHGDHIAAPIDSEGPSVCTNGYAGSFPCRNVDLAYWLGIGDIGGGEGSDIWGWTDLATGREYVIMGRSTGSSFVDISAPENPVYVGRLPSRSGSSDWRDIKVYADHAFIVADDTYGHGLQVFDLTQLREAAPGTVFSTTAGYDLFSIAHNIAINEETGYAYIVGSNTCSGGLHFVDISTPTAPLFAGCYSIDGYTHDVQCVVYDGPDDEHDGKEICFASNADTLTIIDVSNKVAPVMLSRTSYLTQSYTHQGWLTDDHGWFLLNDEEDETVNGFNTRTYIANLADLDAPAILWSYTGETPAIDHNLYIVGNYAYEANYTAGLRIIDISEVASGSLCEAAYLDVYPANDVPSYEGAWSSYPFFASGTVAVSAFGGLALVKPQLDGVSCDGQTPEETAPGAAWFASDPDKISDQYLTMRSAVPISADAELRFWHKYLTEDNYDGGVVEISTDNGLSWQDLGDQMTANGYNDTISISYQSPIAGRMAFTGSSGGYVQTSIDLGPWTGQSARFRFRMASDNSVNSTGWQVDDVEIISETSLSLTAGVGSNEGLTGTVTSQVQVLGAGGECGDGVIAGTNECDDGNTSGGDGCSSKCLVEQCHSCDGEPSVCAQLHGASCDDGSYCNGNDVCLNGSCSVHGGTPCTAGGECSATCSDLRRNCLADAGYPCSSDNDTCTLDYCDGTGICTHVFDSWLCPATTTTTTTTISTTTTTTTTTTTLPQTAKQQRCIIAMNKSGIAVAKRQGKEHHWCVRGATKQTVSDPATCVISDPRGKMARATQKTTKLHGRRCVAGSYPDFGYVNALSVNTAAVSRELEMLGSLFGNDLANVIASLENNASLATCQSFVTKFYERIVSIKLKEFKTCKTKGLKAGLITSPAMIENCVALTGTSKTEKALAKLQRVLDSHCLGIDRGVAFRGTCATAPTEQQFIDCVDEITDCGICTMLKDMDGLGIDCDVFDNGAADGSCP